MIAPLLAAAIAVSSPATGWNVALGAQLVDVFTTHALLKNAGRPAAPGCTAWGFERDPIAAPFTRSVVAGVGVAVVVNVLGRIVFRHSKSAGYIAAGVEAALVANNVRALNAQNGPCH